MYVYASGDGLDRITETSGADDTIYFSSELNSADLRVVRLAGTNDLQPGRTAGMPSYNSVAFKTAPALAPR